MSMKFLVYGKGTLKRIRSIGRNSIVDSMLSSKKSLSPRQGDRYRRPRVRPSGEEGRVQLRVEEGPKGDKGNSQLSI